MLNVETSHTAQPVSQQAQVTISKRVVSFEKLDLCNQLISIENTITSDTVRNLVNNVRVCDLKKQNFSIETIGVTFFRIIHYCNVFYQ